MGKIKNFHSILSKKSTCLAFGIALSIAGFFENHEILRIGTFDGNYLLRIIGPGMIFFAAILIGKDMWDQKTLGVNAFIERYRVESDSLKYLIPTTFYRIGLFHKGVMVCLKAYDLQTPEEIQQRKELIKEYWSVEDYPAAIKQLEHLLHTGVCMTQKNQMDGIVKELNSRNLNNTDVKNFIDSAKQIQIQKGVFISEERILACNTASAFDYIRGGNLAAVFYNLGYISEDECWQYLREFYSAIEKKFNSWEEVCISFLLGRGLWSGDFNQKEYAESCSELFCYYKAEEETETRYNPFQRYKL